MERSALSVVIGLLLCVPARGAPPVPAPDAKEKARQQEARQIGARLLSHKKAGRLRLLNPEREGPQLHQIAGGGFVRSADGTPKPVSLAVLRTLEGLTKRSKPAKPLVLMSLYRSAGRGGTGSLHGRGMALDIAAYAGHRIHSRNPAECERGVLAVIKALGPRAYRLGVPKPPGTDPLALLPPPKPPVKWAFFPAPRPLEMRLLGTRVVAPRVEEGVLVRDKRGVLKPEVLRWENERYAPVTELGSPKVRKAVRAARKRGVVIHSLFPDALDHLHLDVKPKP